MPYPSNRPASPRFRRAARFAAATLAAPLLSSCFMTSPYPAAEGTFERRLEVGSPANLDVAAGTGSITVRVTETRTVHVIGKVRAFPSATPFGLSPTERVQRIVNDPPVEQNGNSIRIGHIDDWELDRNIEISYEVEVPGMTNVVAHAGTGSIAIQGTGGTADLTTGTGSIHAVAVKSLRAGTGTGDITLDSISGGLTATVGTGSISSTNISGPVTARVGTGNVGVAQTAPGDVDVVVATGTVTLANIRGRVSARDSSGSIVIDGEPQGDWRLSTVSGSITARLPQRSAFYLDASTVSGMIRSSHAVTVNAVNGLKSLRGQVGSGGPTVQAHTISGSIEID